MPIRLTRVGLRPPRRGGVRRGRPAVAGVLAAVLLLLQLLAPALGPRLGPALVPAAWAATPDLTLVGAARYTADPENRRVIVSIDLAATNNKADTVIRRYFFDGAYLAVHPGISSLRVSADDGEPSVSVSRRTSSYWMLQIDFGKRLYSGQTTKLRVSFVMKDEGGSPDRPVRVSSTLVAFPVWAYASASTPGSTVTVVIPPGYSVRVEQGSLNGPTPASDGRLVLRSGRLDNPLTFSAYVVADRPPEYGSVPLSTRIGGSPVEIELEPWSDDPAWADRVGGVFTKGLPALGDAIALPYPYRQPLVVREAPSRALGGYAGLFDATAGRVEVAYDASEYVALHEAAHTWFNSSLLADRWANEGFASFYAMGLATELGVTGLPTDTVEDAADGRVPLNAWGAVGSESDAVERYGYAASLELAEQIGDRAGAEGLQRTWQAAAADQSAYGETVGRAVPPVDEPVDWRRLLDLLETSTGVAYDDLWWEWVVRPAEAGLLEERAAAREDLGRTVAMAGDWTLPLPIVDAMDAWQFDTARDLMDQAREVIDDRARLEARSEAVGTTLPGTLEAAFEGDAGPATAAAEADALAAALVYLEQATVAEAAEGAADAPDLQVRVGLMGEEPEADLAAARRAFAAGDLESAADLAASAQLTWEAAASVGWQRILGALGVGLAIATVLALLVLAIRSRRQRRRALAAAGAGYATLAANPEARGGPRGDDAPGATSGTDAGGGSEDRA
jgi:hypothetical protein